MKLPDIDNGAPVQDASGAIARETAATGQVFDTFTAASLGLRPRGWSAELAACAA